MTQQLLLLTNIPGTEMHGLRNKTERIVMTNIMQLTYILKAIRLT